MILNRKHIPWAVFTLLATAAATVLYLANFHPGALPFAFALPPELGPFPPVRRTVGGTPLGLIFGIVSFAIFLFAAALGVRKKRRLWRMGHVQGWLRAHIWLTILTIPLVLFHSGFHLGGPMTSTIMVLYFVVMGSGFFGLGLQQFMPRLMTERLPREVVYEQISHIRGLLVEAAEKLRADVLAIAVKSAPAAVPAAAGEVQVAAALPTERGKVPDDPSPVVLREFLDDEALPYLRSRRGRGKRLHDQKLSDEIFRLLKLNVGNTFREQVEELQRWCDDRRLMEVQTRLHHWLHGWLLIHVPLSFALLIFTIWHAYVALAFLT